MGNPLAADKTWSFTTEAQSPGVGPGGPIQVIATRATRSAATTPRSSAAEGLNEFDVADGPVTAAKLAGHRRRDPRPRGASPTPRSSLLTSWVQGGGNLIAMRPDKKLAGLLGPDRRRRHARQPVHEGRPGQRRRRRDRRRRRCSSTAPPTATALNGATAIAPLYSDAATATSDPAVSLRDVGTGGGQAAAFAYDLARSVVYTRQGNPAWAGQKRDGTPNGIRAGRPLLRRQGGDVQPDWVDMAKIDVPQADEQQRLLANLITEMNRDKAPLPRFWYLPARREGRRRRDRRRPRARRHARVLRPAQELEPGRLLGGRLGVRARDLVRLPGHADDGRAGGRLRGRRLRGRAAPAHACSDFTPASLEDDLSTASWPRSRPQWPSVKQPATNRTHCIVWSDWATSRRSRRRHGIRFDTNYYYNGPPGWLTKPGLLTGSGFPQRFADLDGSMIDVYQAMTQVTDESEMPMAPQVDTLLDNALGPKGYYGVVTVITHTDHGDHANANDIVAVGAGARRAGRLVGADARLARRPQRLVVQGRGLQRRAAQLLGGHEPEGARPRGDAARAVRRPARSRA